MFHDEVTLHIESGKGGAGSASFRREKYIPRGGPDGGDGGKGGDVYLEATRQLSDLNNYASVRDIKADNGVPGAGQKLYGKNAEDLTVMVPVGTRVYRRVGTNWRLVVDMLQENKPFRLLQGGKGGLGNVHFATATNQAPRYAEPGEPGVRSEFKFELQLIADAGIIGLPNAGKSTFLSIVTEAKPKVANYPFTTLSPVLGVIEYHDKRYVLADIPGLIEGASEGKGLGHRFLRHIRRTKVLLHLIDSLSADYAHDYSVIQQELTQFDPELAQKNQLVVISKAELLQDGLDAENVDALKKALGKNSTLFSGVMISAVTRQNIPELLKGLETLIEGEGLDK